MSHSYDTRAFTVASSALPSAFASVEEFSAFERAATERANAQSDGFHYLWGITRNGWAIYTTRALLQSARDVDVIRFLGDDRPVSGERPALQGVRTYSFESEYQLTQATVLDPAAVALASAQLDRVISSIRADPMLVYKADTGAIFSGDDVEAALARDYVSAEPAYDSEVHGDEGESADYLCTYLRSILALFRTAHAQKLSVVHTLII